MPAMEALLAGLGLGLASGVTPGPLFALAIATTLRRGLRAGLQVAAAPLITDTAIIALTLLVIVQLPPQALDMLALIGAIVIGAFAVETLRAARGADVGRLQQLDQASDGRWRRFRQPWAQAVAVNLVNPAAWLFWATVGGPMLIADWTHSPWLAVAFLVGFYLGIVGTKVALVTGIAAGRHRLSTRAYRAVLIGAGLLLAGFAVAFLARGINALA